MGGALSGDRPEDDPRWRQTARLAEMGLLTSVLVHELRQPLFAIKAMAQLGSVEAGADAGRFEAILRQAVQMEELLASYGGLVRDDEGVEQHDLNQAVRDAVAALALQARRRGVELDVGLGDEPLWVRGRAGGTRQIVVNLVQNAIDAVEAGPVRRVRLSTAGGERPSLVVEDTGAGVPSEVRDRIFEPFVTTKPVGRGTGLGLYVTRRIAEGSGGEVRLEDGPAGGARFVVTYAR